MKLYTGTVEMAIRSGADIIPIAIEQYEKSFYVNIGKNISLDETSDLNKKRKLSDDLRDTLCTLKWEIWEQFPITKRSSLPENMGQIFAEKIMSETANDYTIEEIERDRTRQIPYFIMRRQLQDSRTSVYYFITFCCAMMKSWR